MDLNFVFNDVIVSFPLGEEGKPSQNSKLLRSSNEHPRI